MNRKISIFLAEGETHVRQAIRLLLDDQDTLTVTGEASHAESLLAQICQQPPEIILLDWDLPGINPQRLLTAIRQYCPGTRVFATFFRPEQAAIARAYGADACLLKGQLPGEFTSCLKKSLEKSSPRNQTE